MLLTNRGFNNLFDDMFSDPFFTRSYDHTSSQIMKTDIHEKDGNYLVEMELPGYAKEDIKEARGNCVHKERYTGTCNRSFYVGDDLTQDDIKAAFTDGVLRLKFPKDVQKQEDQPKLITIE